MKKNKQSEPNKEESKDPVEKDYNAGKGFLEKGELSQAALSLHNALLGYEERGDQNGIANASNQLGNVCLQSEKFDEALLHYQRAWDICEKENDQMSLVSLQKQFVLVYRGIKQYDKAINGCLELLGIYSANNDPANSVKILDDLAYIYLENGNPSKAADTYKTIASIHARFKHDSIAENNREKAQALLDSQ